MKKLLSIIVVLVLCVGALAACTTVESEPANDTSMFVEVEYSSNWKVVYHRETKVMYAVSWGGYNAGTFTLLVDSDGTPLLWGSDYGKR